MKNGDDDDRPEVVNDGESHEEQFQENRNPPAEQGKHAERKSDIRRCGSGPALHGHRVAAIERNVVV